MSTVTKQEKNITIHIKNTKPKQNPITKKGKLFYQTKKREIISAASSGGTSSKLGKPFDHLKKKTDSDDAKLSFFVISHRWHWLYKCRYAVYRNAVSKVQ